jgi:hypothetical protein
MTVFKDVKPEDQGTWFSYFGSHFDKAAGKFVYDDPAPDAAEFRIRGLIPFFIERMKSRKKEHKFILNPDSRKMEMVSYFEDQSAAETDKERDDGFDFAITGMKKAKWADGKEIECTRENKIKLMKDEEFDRFLARCFALLSGAAEEEKKAAEKN